MKKIVCFLKGHKFIYAMPPGTIWDMRITSTSVIYARRRCTRCGLTQINAPANSWVDLS